MDSGDLLARENEFKKLNKQLEKKTESLMKEIEYAMQKKDIFSDFSTNLTLTPKYTERKRHFCEIKAGISNDQNNTSEKSTPKQIVQKEKVHPNIPSLNLTNVKSTDDTNNLKSINNKCICCTMPQGNLNDDLEFLYAFVSVNIKDHILPQSFIKERVSVKSVCKCLSEKIKLLHEQVAKMQAAINVKTKQCELHMSHIADLETTKLNLTNAANTMTAQTADIRAKYTLMQNKLTEKERQYKEQRSETDKLLVELKKERTKYCSMEGRCAAQEELVDNLKHQIEKLKLSDKDLRESFRSMSARHQSTVTRLETRTRGLMATVEKQNALVDNLRRQNALLVTDGALRTLEKDYNDFLNQDF